MFFSLSRLFHVKQSCTQPRNEHYVFHVKQIFI